MRQNGIRIFVGAIRAKNSFDSVFYHITEMRMKLKKLLVNFPIFNDLFTKDFVFIQKIKMRVYYKDYRTI